MYLYCNAEKNVCFELEFNNQVETNIRFFTLLNYRGFLDNLYKWWVFGNHGVQKCGPSGRREVV